MSSLKYFVTVLYCELPRSHDRAVIFPILNNICIQHATFSTLTLCGQKITFMTVVNGRYTRKGDSNSYKFEG